MSMGLTGLKALVSGGASGIGLATARMLEARGAQVAILDRDAAALATAAGFAARECADVADTAAVETTVDTTPVTVIEGPVQIDVVVGVDSGEDRVVKVTVGSDITLNITNPNADDEYHVHGIDIEQEAAKGEMATINFTITEAGTYEVESHITEDVLVVIEAE